MIESKYRTNRGGPEPERKGRTPMQMEEKYWKRLEGFLLAVSVALCLVVFHSVFRGLVYLLPRILRVICWAFCS